MKIERVDIEDWNALDFANYLRRKLEDKGIEYKLQFPTDVMFVGKLTKAMRASGYTQYYIKDLIDTFFKEKEISQVNSLQFLGIILKPKSDPSKPKTTRFTNSEVSISPGLQTRLERLKTG